MNRRSYLMGLVLLFIASIMPAAAAGQTSSPANPPDEKPLAPPFSLMSLKGETVDLSALRGKVVVLNFWFTGCEPCVAEFPQLNSLVKEFKDKGVVFIAPTLDDAATLKPFLKEHKLKYQIVPNAGGLIVVTYSDGTGSVVFPTHIVIDKEGKIDTRVTGAKGVEEVRKTLARLTK